MIEALLYVSGWALAALMFGLWLGERGRRLDAQRREGVIQVDPPKPAKTIPPGGEGATAPDASLEEAREKYVAEAVAEGFAEQAAAEDFDRMMGRIETGQGQVWSPDL